MTHPITRSLLLLGLQLSLLACTVLKPPPQAGAPAGISGVILSASDVSGVPDVPLPGQLILAVPITKAGDILGSGADRFEDQKLRFLKVNLPSADLSATYTVSDPSGRYSLDLEPGEYILCALDSKTTPPGFPARTRGCGRAQVLPGKIRRIDISSGFGEILLQQR